MDEGTLQFYRSNARSYADWAKAPSTRLRGFLALLPSGGSILELGCGAGNHSAVMLAEGFSVRATDGSPEMAEIASHRLGHAVEAMRFDQLDAHEAYDGVWASACLLHVPRDELTGILARIHRALRPSGVFYASYKMGEGDGRDSLGRYYNYASPEWLEATYASAGPWITLSSDRNVIQSFDETPANMLHLVVRKA
ncbi:class I SAM-dependent methyltransferase [Bradyrhizobium sp. 4]|uniref:class I SAM-dependent methyltransferase n=1 Tax=unclassified Bradyrhizobium TaxID=2631580 RepID=UPI001FF7CF6C|nr:class I SAM-dependent methyltransferase [Bradyrhizobium sp. 4]MCK1402142.1 class I SAM-dependent methyltransferase [Bradyrhizobium sp. 39]MCK1751138.1 class I SAM-dependent methyltransferase [Bradyrhizobium sp. 135]UPJ38399.1 class I SAM-dependent methyltransferase [Bradyrhizobium sp. 4]